MKKAKNKWMAGVLAGTLLLGGAGFANVANAAEENPPAQTEAKRPKIDVDAVAKDVVSRYGVDESEVREALGARRNLDDIYYAALLSKASGKSFKTIMDMKMDWWEVERKLNITEAQIDAAASDMMAEDIAERSGLDTTTVAKLLKEHYHPRDIRIAGRLAEASGKDVQTVLDMKKINQRWRDIAKELNVDPKVLRPKTDADAQEDAEANEAEPMAEGKATNQ